MINVFTPVGVVSTNTIIQSAAVKGCVTDESRTVPTCVISQVNKSVNGT